MTRPRSSAWGVSCERCRPAARMDLPSLRQRFPTTSLPGSKKSARSMDFSWHGYAARICRDGPPGCFYGPLRPRRLKRNLNRGGTEDTEIHGAGAPQLVCLAFSLRPSRLRGEGSSCINRQGAKSAKNFAKQNSFPFRKIPGFGVQAVGATGRSPLRIATQHSLNAVLRTYNDLVAAWLLGESQCPPCLRG